MPHFRNPPFYDIAKVLIVDVVVLFPNRPLRAFFQLVLPITAKKGKHVTSACSSIRAGSMEWYLHFNKTVVTEHGDDFIQLFRLEAHSTRKIIVFEAVNVRQRSKEHVNTDRKRLHKMGGWRQHKKSGL